MKGPVLPAVAEARRKAKRLAEKLPPLPAQRCEICGREFAPNKWARYKRQPTCSPECGRVRRKRTLAAGEA